VLCCAVLCCAVLLQLQLQLQPLAVCLLSGCRADLAVRDSRGRRRHDSGRRHPRPLPLAAGGGPEDGQALVGSGLQAGGLGWWGRRAPAHTSWLSCSCLRSLCRLLVPGMSRCGLHYQFELHSQLLVAQLAPCVCRSFDDVELAVEPGSPLAPAGEGGAFPLTPEQRFSLDHWRDLLEGTSECPVLLGMCCSCFCVPQGGRHPLMDAGVPACSASAISSHLFLFLAGLQLRRRCKR
jgi:hypothetical protein